MNAIVSESAASKPASAALSATAPAPRPVRAAAANAGLGGWRVWALFALVLGVLPIVFGSSLAQTLLSQIGIAVIACLAYNILLGQGGMLSFGHALYSGLGAFCAVHTLNLIAGGALALPVSMIPLVGGVAGLFFAALIGYVTTKKSGTTFAMITLGLGELVWNMSLMLPEFFGGEGGVSTNRVVGKPFLGITFGPQIQVYYLIAVYCFACTGLMYAFTRTPLGRILNAVRDNPERVEFIGYSTQRVRYLAFMISGFFAGIAGGLGALNFEIVNAEVVGTGRSGAYLLFVFLGGTSVFYGPIIGAVLMVFALVLLSELTKAWLLYLGLVFMLMVMYAPGGIASIVSANLRVIAHGGMKKLWRAYLAVGAALVPVLGGAFALIEMIYHLQLNASFSGALHFLGLSLDTRATLDWTAAAATLAAGLVALELARRYASHCWNDVQHDIAAAHAADQQAGEEQ